MKRSLQNQNMQNMNSNMQEGKDSKSMSLKLNKLFDLAWMILYQGPSYKEIENVQERYIVLQEKYRGLQGMIMKEAATIDGKDAVKYQIASLKLLDMMYKELVDNDFKKNAEEQGLSKLETKILLREKIFGVKDRKGQEQKKTDKIIKQRKSTEETIQERKSTEETVQERKSTEETMIGQQENKEKGKKIEVRQEVNQTNKTGKNIIDFEEMYYPGVIANLENGEKNVLFQQYKIPEKFEQQLEDRRIVLTHIGKLRYCNVFGLQTYINKYSLLIFLLKNGEPKMVQKDIYGDIDYEMLQENIEYRKAIFEQLLTLENIDRKGNNGYIGGISPSGKEDKYKVYYSIEDYTAIKVYEEQSRRKLDKILEEFKGEEK